MAVCVSREVENELGQVAQLLVVADHRGCRGTDGQRALEQLEARLAHGETGDLVVIDNGTAKAMALPRARMVIMLGLLQ